eukprot:scaffold502648_cov18-Prasinocladus_malaysianus.AAC.1
MIATLLKTSTPKVATSYARNGRSSWHRCMHDITRVPYRYGFRCDNKRHLAWIRSTSLRAVGATKEPGIVAQIVEICRSFVGHRSDLCGLSSVQGLLAALMVRDVDFCLR